MSTRFFLKDRTSVTLTLVLALLLVACSPFGEILQVDRAPSTERAATSLPSQPPASAETLATPTMTLAPATSTPMAAATPTPTATEEPTATPTAEAETEASVALEATTAATPTVEEAATEASVASVATAATTPVVHAVLVAPTSQEAAVFEDDIIVNGSFEDGFDQHGVAQGWTAFSSSREGAVYAWEDETDWQHISHGEHAQLMRIMGPGRPDQYVGIYQTVEVVAGETYNLAIHGVIQSSVVSDKDDCPCSWDEGNPFAFRFQWAAVDGGAVDWQTIPDERWTDPGWNDIGLDTKWRGINAYVAQITPQSDTLTLYIRGWSKWALFQSEAKFYVDGVSLEGPVMGKVTAEAVPDVQIGLPTTGGDIMGMIAIAGAILILGLALREVRKIWVR